MTHDRDDLRAIDLSPLDWRSDRGKRDRIVTRIVHDVEMIWLEQDGRGRQQVRPQGLDLLGNRFRWGMFSMAGLTTIAATWALMFERPQPVLRAMPASTVLDVASFYRVLTRWAIGGTNPTAGEFFALFGAGAVPVFAKSTPRSP